MRKQDAVKLILMYKNIARVCTLGEEHRHLALEHVRPTECEWGVEHLRVLASVYNLNGRSLTHEVPSNQHVANDKIERTRSKIWSSIRARQTTLKL